MRFQGGARFAMSFLDGVYVDGANGSACFRWIGAPASAGGARGPSPSVNYRLIGPG